MKVIEADQTRPYELMKNIFLHGNQYKDLLQIARKNQPHMSTEEIIEMFKKLSSTGCSCAALANTIVDQVYTDDFEFRKMFGFSLYVSGRDVLDYNKLAVDIFSRLYDVAVVRFLEYDKYSFKSLEEAALSILGVEFENNQEAALALFKKGISGEGFDQEGNLLFKSRFPKITKDIGKCRDIAKDKFGIDDVKSFSELSDICKQKGIVFEYKDLQIVDKLTGLRTDSFNFWCDYYFASYNLDFTVVSEKIHVSEFCGDFEKFQDYLLELIGEGFSINVSTGPGRDTYMHTKKKLSWGRIGSDDKGHVMSFKKFDLNGDFIVSSYGEEHIIPKEFFTELEFSKIIKKKRSGLEKEDKAAKNM